MGSHHHGESTLALIVIRFGSGPSARRFFVRLGGGGGVCDEV